MSRNIKIIIGFVLTVMALVGVSYLNFLKEEKIKSQAVELFKSQNLNKTISHTRDSLNMENNLLSRHKSLTNAMVYRDSIRKVLPYKVGDVAHAKRDSSRVVIKDIIVGGGKFEYYIRYQILNRDNSVENVSPELIY
jgi:hypothetical protein